MTDGSRISKKDADKIVKEMKVFTKKVSASPSLAKEFLQRAGILTSAGNLKAQYK